MGFPIVVEFVTHGNDDGWLRDKIRGLQPREVEVHRVIVESGDSGFMDEAHRLVNRLANIKYDRHLPYGGANYYRWDGIWPPRYRGEQWLSTGESTNRSK